MTVRHGLFVQNGSAGVTPPQDARLALAGLVQGAPGIMAGTGGAVTGSTSGPNMQYVVPAAVIATVRGTLAADGAYLSANDGNVTVNTATPAPGSGQRYDVIWARAKNANDGFGDPNSDFELNFTVGTASGSPVVPAIPSGAVALAQALVGTSIANASLATITQLAGAVVARGGSQPIANLAAAPASPFEGQLAYDMATNTQLAHNGSAWAPVGARRIAAASFATDLSSSGTTEQVGHSQVVNLIAGRRYRVWWKGYVLGGATAGQGRIQLRYDAGALTITSTAIEEPFGTVCVSTSNPNSWFFSAEFVASGTGPFNLGYGMRTGTGTGNTVAQGTVIPIRITIDDVSV